MYTFPLKIAGQTVIVKTHDAADSDEYFAALLASLFGTPEFVRTYCPDNKLAVGIDGGVFDEHPKNGEPRKPGSCTSRMSDVLGVSKDHRVSRLIDEITLHDTEGAAKDAFKKGKRQILSLPRTIDALHIKYPNDPDKVTEVAFVLFDSVYFRECVIQEGRAELIQRGQREEIAGPTGKPLRLVSIVAANPVMYSAAWTLPGGADVLIQQWPLEGTMLRGNVQIYTNSGSGLDLVDVARILNVQEQIKAGSERIICDPAVLSQEGTIPGGRWYHFPQTRALFNGSWKYRDVPATRLSLPAIIQCIKWAFDPSFFDPPRWERCLQGTCTSAENPCPFQAWHLRRCVERGLVPLHVPVYIRP